MNTRLHRLYTALDKKGLDGLLVSHEANITYLTKYPSRDSYFLASRKENHYFTDGRYAAEARLKLKGCAVIKQTDRSVFKQIACSAKDLRLKRIGFEERIMPFAEHKKICAYMGEGTKLVAVSGVIEEMRQYKDPEEIKKIKEAVSITAGSLRFVEKFIKPGVTELEVGAELERYLRQKGATKASFDIIVGSGPNSSYPHHITSGRKLRKNEPVLIDMGVEYDGYKSDLTRVFFLGKMSSLVNKVYRIVLDAQKKALDSIEPGIKASSIDAVARRYIAQKGFGACFSHSLGHGVGLEVHEEPHISAKSDTIIAESMVFTLEPGIYLTGKFGIRFEDMVLVTDKKGEVLSGAVDK